MNKLFVIIFLLMMVSAIVADISDFRITPFFDGLDDGTYTVELEFGAWVTATENIELIVTGSSSVITVSANFSDGYSSIYLSDLDVDELSTGNLTVYIEVVGEGYTDTLIFHSAAYGIYANYAEEVVYPDAGGLIAGSVFENVVSTAVGIQTYLSSGDSGLLFSNAFPIISDGSGLLRMRLIG